MNFGCMGGRRGGVPSARLLCCILLLQSPVSDLVPSLRWLHLHVVVSPCVHRCANGNGLHIENKFTLQVLLPRATNVDYSVVHWHGHLFMVKRTATTPNSELFITSLEAPSEQHSLRAHRDDIKIEDVHVFNKHIALLERANGLSECHVFELPNPSEAQNACLFSSCMRCSMPA